MTFCNLSVSPLHREERQKLNMMQKTGLDTLIRSAMESNALQCDVTRHYIYRRYEEEKLIEKQRKKKEKEDKLANIKERNKKNPK